MLRARTCTVALLMIALVFTACKRGPTEQELFERAKKYQEESNFQGAIDTYQEIVKRYPKSKEAPQCQFMIGYLYANHLKNNQEAEQAYKTFIRNYPEHELVKDAQWELDHLGKDVNQIDELNRILAKDTTKAPEPTNTGAAK